MVQNQGGLIMEIISKSSMGELIISDEVHQSQLMRLRMLMVFLRFATNPLML